MARSDDIAQAVRQRDGASVVRFIFQGESVPQVRLGYKTETELWDYKHECPPLGRADREQWADIAKDVVAFHNNRGGVVFFGVDDRSFEFVGTRERIDSKLFNEKIRRYVGDSIWVQFSREYIQSDQRYLGVALIPPRGPLLATFKADGPVRGTQPLFKTGESAIREGDESRLLTKTDVADLVRTDWTADAGPIGVDEPFYRVLQLETSRFIERPEDMKSIISALRDQRTSTTSIVGIGGVGKTTLATWCAMHAYDEDWFEFIVSLTAKDRELTASGIQSVAPQLSTFDSLLDTILDVLQFPDVKASSTQEKENAVADLIQSSSGLIYVDNLETVDDQRVISFLDELPLGVRGLVTSRRSKVTVSVRPIEIGPFRDVEARDFIRSLDRHAGLEYVVDFSTAELDRIATAYDRIPLAIRFGLARVDSASEALSAADRIGGARKSTDEILEFCFRRILESMTTDENKVVETLSVFERPLPHEALVAGSNASSRAVADALDELVKDSIVVRRFDADRNDYVYTLLPLTRVFIYSDVSKSNREDKIRQRLSRWFEAKDVSDPHERLVVRTIRQGRENPESALLDLAKAADRQGRYDDAEELYTQALARNPQSYEAPRLYAEFHRHRRKNTRRALELYEHAARNSPSRGRERALIYREWGMLLRDAGSPDATDLAIDKFLIALEETPNDPVVRHALADMRRRKGQYRLVIDLLEPLLATGSAKTKRLCIPLLIDAYQQCNEFVKAADLRQGRLTDELDED